MNDFGYVTKYLAKVFWIFISFLILNIPACFVIYPAWLSVLSAAGAVGLGICIANKREEMAEDREQDEE